MTSLSLSLQHLPSARLSVVARRPRFALLIDLPVLLVPRSMNPAAPAAAGGGPRRRRHRVHSLRPTTTTTAALEMSVEATPAASRRRLPRPVRPSVNSILFRPPSSSSCRQPAWFVVAGLPPPSPPRRPITVQDYTLLRNSAYRRVSSGHGDKRRKQ